MNLKLLLKTLILFEMNISEMWQVAWMIIAVITSYIWLPIALAIIGIIIGLLLFGIVMSFAYVIDVVVMLKNKVMFFLRSKGFLKRKYKRY